MRTRIKICCMANAAEVALAVSAGADAVGLVGPMPSGPGTIDDAAAAAIAPAVPPGVTSVLLTAETTAAGIADHVARVGAAAVQVVDHVDPAEQERLGRRAPAVRRIQVIHVEGDDALDLAAAYAPFVDAFLLDSGRPSAAVRELGGTGRTHDWEISRRFVERSARPVFLAGGLTPANVGEAITTVRPYGVDVCSGVRIDGALDAQTLARFVAAVHAADGAIEGRG